MGNKRYDSFAHRSVACDTSQAALFSSHISSNVREGSVRNVGKGHVESTCTVGSLQQLRVRRDVEQVITCSMAKV
jgi:hypothetical protein